MDSFRDAGETARAIDSLVQSAKDRSDFCCGHKSCHQAECKVSQLSPTRRAFSPTATSLDKQAQTSPVKLNPAPAPPNSIIQGAADSLIRGFFGAANSTGFNEEIYKNVITAQDVADLHNKIERLKGELDMKQSELACTTTTLHSELLKAEQKITKLTFVSESAEASMVMYRGELEKKSKKLLDLEDEIAQLKEDSLANKPTYASSSRAISPSR